MATPKKAPAKRAPAKKAPAKKAPTKEAPAKQAPTKTTPAAAKVPAAAAKKAPAAKPAAKQAKPGALTVGAPAPPFSLVADDGRTVSLDAFRGKKVVVYFYPKDDTPGCTRESCAFSESQAELAGKGAVVLGISRDGTASHVRFKHKYGLTLPLLSDPDASVHRAYGAWGEKTLYGKTSEGVLRTTVVIDADGNVAKVFGNVKVDGHVEKVLAAL